MFAAVAAKGAAAVAVVNAGHGSASAPTPEGQTAGSPPLTALTPHKLGERKHPPNVAVVRVSRRGTRRADGGDIEKSCVETIHHISPPHEEAEPGKEIEK